MNSIFEELYENNPGDELGKDTLERIKCTEVDPLWESIEYGVPKDEGLLLQQLTIVSKVLRELTHFKDRPTTRNIAKKSTQFLEK